MIVWTGHKIIITISMVLMNIATRKLTPLSPYPEYLVSTRSVTTIFMEKFSKLNTVCDSQELFP